MLQLFLGPVHGHGGCFGVVFHTLHHPVAPLLLRTFTRTQGSFLSGFPHTTSSRCSGISWDLYMDMGVVFFGVYAHYIIQFLQSCSGHLPGQGLFFRVFRTLHHPVTPVSLGIFTQTQEFAFSGFTHTASSSRSGFAQDIYLETGVGFFGFSAHYII